jgi:hypothetical protein
MQSFIFRMRLTIHHSWCPSCCKPQKKVLRSSLRCEILDVQRGEISCAGKFGRVQEEQDEEGRQEHSAGACLCGRGALKRMNRAISAHMASSVNHQPSWPGPPWWPGATTRWEKRLISCACVFVRMCVSGCVCVHMIGYADRWKIRRLKLLERLGDINSYYGSEPFVCRRAKARKTWHALTETIMSPFND